MSGGGLKLEHLPGTLPGNWAKIYKAYGDVLLGLALAGIVVGAVLRPTFTLAIGFYLLLALLFYSCWGRPYGRYLLGIYLLVPVLIVEGVVGSLDLVRWLGRRGAMGPARWISIAGVVLLVAGTLALAPAADGTALPALTYLLGLGVAAALGAAVMLPERRIVTVAAPALALGLVWLGSVRLAGTLSTRAPFQGPQVERASAVVRRTLAPRAVVITTEDIGRPAENFEYHGGVPLELWHLR